MRESSQRERLFLRAARRIGDGAPAAKVCRELGIAEAELAKWRWEREPQVLRLARRVSELARENRRLRTAVDDAQRHRRLLLDAFNRVFPPLPLEPEQHAEGPAAPGVCLEAPARDRSRLRLT